MVYQLPEEIHQMLDDRKKKLSEEVLHAVLVSFQVDRLGNITKVMDNTFTSTSTDAPTKVIPNVSDSSSGVTLDQVKSMLAERDIYLVNWLSSKEWETTNKQPAITHDPPPVVSSATCETPIFKPSAASSMYQPQFGMSLNYFSGQIVTPTNVMVAQCSYLNILETSLVQPTFTEQMSLPILYLHTVCLHIARHLYHLEVLWHLSVLSQIRCLTDICKDDKTSKTGRTNFSSGLTGIT